MLIPSCTQCSRKSGVVRPRCYSNLTFISCTAPAACPRLLFVRLFQAFQVGGQTVPGVIRTVFFHDSPERVLGVGAFDHGLIVPVQNNLRALGTDFRVLVFDIFLLVDVCFQVVKHFSVKEMETVMIASHIEPVAKTGGTLAHMGHLGKYQAVPTCIFSIVYF